MVYSVSVCMQSVEGRNINEEEILQAMAIIEEDCLPTIQRCRDVLRMCIDASVLNKQIILSDNDKVFDSLEEM